MEKKLQKAILIVSSLLMFISSFTTVYADETNHQQPPSQKETIMIHAVFDQPRTQEVLVQATSYLTVHCKEGQEAAQPGYPLLPRFQKTVLLPPQTKIKTVRIIDQNEQFLAQGTLLPAGTPFLSSEQAISWIPQPNPDVYRSQEPYPPQTVKLAGTQQFRGYCIEYLDICPFQYIPKTGRLTFYQSISLELELEPEPHTTTLFRALPQDEDAVEKIVENPDVLPSYSEQQLPPPIDITNKQCSLLLITTEPLQRAFRPLIVDHSRKGIFTRVLLLGRDIPQSQDTNTTCHNIRAAIQDAYARLGVEYVLLGGDMNIIPAPYFYFGSHQETGDRWGPSDLFYSCLDGPFNNDGDDRWGEPTDGLNGGEVDLVAEVYVGRACVGNVSEVNHFVNKTLRTVKQQENDEQKDVLLAGQYLCGPLIGYPLTLGDQYLEELINGSDACGYTTVGFPNDTNSIYEFDRLYDGTWPGFDPFNPYSTGWPKEELITRINYGVDIINNVGHAGDFINMKLYLDDVLGLTNKKLNFIYSQGCVAGGFDLDPYGPYDDCMAEFFTIKTEHAAYAGIWNSREGFYTPNGTGSSSQAFNRQFWDAVFGEDIAVISQANQDSKEDLIHIIHDDQFSRWTCYGLNYFGDPTLAFTQRPFHADPHGPYSGLSNHTIQFSGSAYCGTPPYEWHWDFGDGNTSKEKRPTHRYIYNGVYPLILTVKDSKGHKDTSTTNVTIELRAEAYGPYYGIVGTSVQFQGSIQGGLEPYNWTWDFGDGNYSYEQNPVYTYSTPIVGERIILQVTDALGNTDTDTARIDIVPMIVYVDDGYTPSTPGYNIDHFNRIQTGITNVASGGTVYVFAGTYTDNLWITKPISLLGESRYTTSIRSSDPYTTVHIHANNVFVSGFTITNTNNYWMSAVQIQGSNTTITNNSISSTYGYGVELWYGTADNLITKNTITNSEFGIYLSFSTRNIFYENTIQYNNVGVIIETWQETNLFYHNNFKQNGEQVYDNSEDGTSWDNGYPSGGNYWDDFRYVVGPLHDYFNGEFQDILGSDSILDLGLPQGGLNPYPVGNGQDRFPFVVQNGWN